MKKQLLVAAIMIMALATSSCALVNPYKGSFACPDYDKGKCTSVKNAYQEDIGRHKFGSEPAKEGKDGVVKATETEYQKEVYGKLSSLLRSPKTPMVTPPKVMRILFLPYKGENSELFMSRYAYLLVDEPKWVMGGYLADDPAPEEE